uniref:Uncharacterized protein n=1 Tax=Tanacetum cinerariifolium TaxID=118510 RepID=A0A6L2M7L2_TANCI|nr:hypothetical protein [Tanacetum cinerariifolium]
MNTLFLDEYESSSLALHREERCEEEDKIRSLETRSKYDTDEEVNKQELEAYYMYMAKIQEILTVDFGPTYNAKTLEKVHTNNDYNVFATEALHFEHLESINDTYVVKEVDSNVIPDSSDMCYNEEKADQNAEEPEDEHALLASLIANLKTRC